MTTTSVPTKVVTGEVRFSYANLFRPRATQFSEKEQYSVQLIIPKSDKKTVAKINDAVKAAAAKKFNGKAPSRLRHPLRDADLEAEESGETVKPELEGCYFVSVKCYDKPQVVDRQMQEVLDPQELVSGDYGRVSMNASGYDVSGNKGVSFWLNNVQFLRKGEPLGAGSRAEDDFDAVDDDGDDWMDAA